MTVFCPDEKSKKQICNILCNLNIAHHSKGSTVCVDSQTDIGLCDSCDIDALVYFKNKNIPVITCGMSAKDTLTLTSLDDGTAMVAVQRNLPFEFNDCEKPEEYPLHFNGKPTPFTIMVAFTLSKSDINLNNSKIINFLN